MNVVGATRNALDKLRGTWGLVVMDSQLPDQLVIAKNGSPMVIGICEGKSRFWLYDLPIQGKLS